jgi:hypothetical protein
MANHWRPETAYKAGREAEIFGRVFVCTQDHVSETFGNDLHKKGVWREAHPMPPHVAPQQSTWRQVGRDVHVELRFGPADCHRDATAVLKDISLSDAVARRRPFAPWSSLSAMWATEDFVVWLDGGRIERRAAFHPAWTEDERWQSRTAPRTLPIRVRAEHAGLMPALSRSLAMCRGYLEIAEAHARMEKTRAMLEEKLAKAEAKAEADRLKAEIASLPIRFAETCRHIVGLLGTDENSLVGR